MSYNQICRQRSGSNMLKNPYEILYRQMDFHKMPVGLSREKASECIKHLGFMYNTFGQAIKDLVKIVAIALPEKPKQTLFLAPKGGQIGQGKQDSKKPSDLFKRKANTNNLKQRIDQEIIQQTTAVTSQSTSKTIEVKQLEAKKIKKMQQRGPANENLSRQSDKPPQQKKSETVLDNAQAYSHLPLFESQFQCNSPEKTEPNQKQQIEAEIYRLSHGQRFIDPSQCILQEDYDQSLIPHSNLLQTTTVSQPIPKQPSYKEPEPTKLQPISTVKETECVRFGGRKKKKEREKMTGMSCVECQKYYKVMQIKFDGLCECTSRHRSNMPAKKYKNNFTQEFDGF